MSEDEKQEKTKIGQPPAQKPGVAEEETTGATEAKQVSQPSPTREPGGAPGTALQTESKNISPIDEALNGKKDEPRAEPAPAALAKPPQSSPTNRAAPSISSAPTRQAKSRQGWKPSWWKNADRWARQHTTIIGIVILATCAWTFIIVAVILWGPLAFNMGKGKIAHVAQMVMPSKQTAKPAPPPTPLKPPVIECHNYTAARELDGSISTKNCECSGGNCPVKIVCTGDQYKVTYNWDTITNPDDTEQRYVKSTTVDTSNCEHFF